MNILVVKLSSIGDIVFATPCLHALRKHWPAARITVAVNRSFTALLGENPDVDTLWTRRATRPTKRVRSFAEAAWSGLVHRYPRLDLAIDLQGTFHSTAWASCSGARRVAGLGSGRRYWEFAIPIDHKFHAVDQCAMVLERLGVPVIDRKPRLHPSAADDVGVVARLRALGLPDRGYVVVHPFTAWRSKEWPAERYVAVLRRLAERPGFCAVVSGSESEAPRAKAICDAVGSGRVTSVAGMFSLGESLALWSRASLFVGGDTGALHASAAMGVRCVALYGPTSVTTTGPIGEQHRILQALVPESHHAYREPGGGRFMAAISEAQVLDAVTELIP
jgi:ADP-heptose:LPS heptosyltransferase